MAVAAATPMELLVGILCLGLTLCWWRGKSSTSTSGHDNSCNNPNCLRCHSSSRRHAAEFKRNAAMLRRLARLEPDLFGDVSEELWGAVEARERTFDDEKKDPSWRGWLSRMRKLVLQSWESWRRMCSNDAVANSATGPALPLAPQAGQEPTVFLVPGLEAVPLHDAISCRSGCPCMRLWKALPRDEKAPPVPVTGDIEALRQSYDVIRKELLDHLSGEQTEHFTPFDPNVYTEAGNTAESKEAQNNAQQPEWSSIYLYHQGVRQSEPCNKYFPQTTHILETKCPHLIGGKCGLGSVYFSKLRRNTQVKEHCGPTNVRWRCHLPLVVPENGSGQGSSQLCVGLGGVNERRVGWTEGTPILFDDSFFHSAVHPAGNDSEMDALASKGGMDVDGARIVLIIDFWHPSLTDADRTALGVLYPPGR